MQAWEFEAIGTVWQVLTPTALSANHKRSVSKRIEAFDTCYSRFRSDSLVSAMSQRAGTYQLPDDAMPLFTLYRQLYDLSSGRVTPLVGSLMEQAGYGPEYSLKPQTLTHVPVWDDVIHLHGTQITIKSTGVLLDFGAAGKGYLVDIMVDILRGYGIHDFIINAGGDVWIESGPEAIGLEDPQDHGRAIGEWSVGHAALCASSPSRRQWSGYHHIIDPSTLRSEPTVMATWVVANSCLLADGLATALSFIEPAVLAKHFEFEYVMIKSGSIHMSANCKATLYTAHETNT